MEDGAKLIAHRGAQIVSYDDLAQYQTPEATATWKPVGHKQLVDTLKGVMADRGLHVTREQYAVDNHKLFGTFDTEWQKMEDFGAAVGFRHANDKSMPIQIAVGARVFVCDNMSFLGELIAIRRHTSRLDLGEELDRSMYRYMQGFRRLMEDIQIQKDSPLDDRKAKTLIYDIFTQKIVPLRLFPLITEHYAHIRQDNTVPITGWWLHNVFTAHVKALAPAPAFRATARLGKFFASKF